MSPHRKTKLTISAIFILLFNMSFLTAQQSTLSGTISKSDGTLIENVMVVLEGDMEASTTTDANGYYEFFALPGGNYTITPISDETNIYNGINSTDVNILSNHINSIVLFDSPYQYIAGDVDGSQSSGPNDLTTLENFLQFIITEFPVPSWQFVDKNFVFPENP